MRVKKVPLQDLELWPDEVICFTAYTDTRNPVQQRRTYVDGAALKDENAKLREHTKWLESMLLSRTEYYEDLVEVMNAIRDNRVELGIEVDE